MRGNSSRYQPLTTSVLRQASSVLFFSSLTPVCVNAADAQASEGIQEIVVTAQKRAENLQDTPITMAAFAAEDIEQAAISNTTDLSIVTPGLTMTQSGGGVLPYIRGIGAVSAAGGQESPVAIFLDGVYWQMGYGADLALQNVERVEVLKGPQGTLFGRNVTGGLIHIITKDPSTEPSADVRVFGGNYERYGANFYGTTGIGSNVAADLSVSYSDQGKGFGKNTYLGTRRYFRDEKTARSKWKYSNDATNVTLALLYSEVDLDKGQFRRLPDGSVGVGGLVHEGGYWDLQSDVSTFTNHVKNKGVSLKWEQELEPFDFLSISAYNNQQADAPVFDNDFTQAPIQRAGTLMQTKYFTQEVQLASNNTEGNTWIVGAYYLDSESITDLAVSTLGGFFSQGRMQTDSIAGFGEYTFKFTDSTRATAGVRYTWDKRHIEGTQFGAPIREETTKWDEPTYRAVLQHDLADDLMLYGSYTRGFKSGNYNVTSPTGPAVNPEFVDAYEVGMKSSFLDNRLRLNAAAFYYDYKDLQLTIYQGSSTLTVNAASAEIKGLDLSVVALLTRSLQLDLGVSVLDSKYKSFPNYALAVPNRDANGVPTGGNSPPSAADMSGNPMVRAPDLTANLGATYTCKLPAGELVSAVRVAYTEGFPWEPDGRLREDDYIIVNASLGWRDDSDRWGVGIVGKNIFEEEYAIQQSTTTRLNDFLAPGEPATFSVYLDHRF